MPFIFCPKCGIHLEIRDIIDNAGAERKELYCTKCDFKKIYGK
jgi:DNA-directed RNA polymerase subunit M/transcription elongation factor TFIIS